MRNKFALAALAVCCARLSSAAELHVNELDYLEAQGLSVLVYQNRFHAVFRDQKLGGVEIILHGERIATGGEVRLLPAPEQWDAVPTFIRRRHGAVADQLIAYSGYPDQGLSYRIEVSAEAQGFRIAVNLDHALPQASRRQGGLQSRLPAHRLFRQELFVRRRTGILSTPSRRAHAGAARTAWRSPCLWRRGDASCWRRKTP